MLMLNKENKSLESSVKRFVDFLETLKRFSLAAILNALFTSVASK